METDFVFHIAIGVKNDGLTQEAGRDAISVMLQNQIEDAVMGIPWVTDMLMYEDGEEK
jgi:hypothetical protein